MQLTLNIKNSNTIEKILLMLEYFKSDGIKLKDEEKIDFKGSPKIGGYIVK